MPTNLSSEMWLDHLARKINKCLALPRLIRILFFFTWLIWTLVRSVVWILNSSFQNFSFRHGKRSEKFSVKKHAHANAKKLSKKTPIGQNSYRGLNNKKERLSFTSAQILFTILAIMRKLCQNTSREMIALGWARGRKSDVMEARNFLWPQNRQHWGSILVRNICVQKRKKKKKKLTKMGTSCFYCIED